MDTNINTAEAVATVVRIVLDHNVSISEAWEALTGDYQMSFDAYLEAPKGVFWSNSSSVQKQAWSDLLELVDKHCGGSEVDKFITNELGDPVCWQGSVWGAWELLDGFDDVEEFLTESDKAEIAPVIERFKRVIPPSR